MRFIRLQSAVLTLSLLAVAVFFGGYRVARAQSTSGDIVGTVLDRTGAAISGATVTATNVATGVATTVEANSVGDYHISNLLPGIYNVTGKAKGFSTFTLKGFLVKLNNTGTAALVLPVASASTNVEVSAEAPAVLDTTTTQLQSSFEPQELNNMPTASVGLGVLNLALLVPGVASGGGLGDGTGPSVGGQRARSNNYTIEGIDNNDKSVTGPLVYVPSSAVGEFTVITNQFSPEFGHSVGGQFNTVIVSGTNQLHGSVYEYFQNRNLNAENAVEGGKVPNPRYDNNRYGGQIGGPIKKDKIFYFGNFERNTIGQQGQYWLCTPTAGGMTTLADGTHNFSASNLGIFNKYMGPVTSATQVTSANDLACGDGSGPQYTPVYSDGEFNSNTGLYGTGGEADIPLGNYSIVAPNYSNFEALTTGANWTISSRDSFRARYIYNRSSAIDTSAYLPAFFLQVPSRYHLIALSEYHSFTANLTNEVRLGYNRFSNTYSAGDFSFPGLDVFPNLTMWDLGGLNIGPDPNAPQGAIQNLYQLTDNVSWVKGKHNLKFGFDGRRFIAPQTFTQRARGDYEWKATTEYLHDLAPTSFGERSTGNITYYGNQSAFYGYANDVWHYSDKLSINMGVRYEFTSVPQGERQQVLNSLSSVPGLIDFHSPKPQYFNFVPRFGFNYAPNENTSIRAGFGMGIDVLYDNLGLLSAPPQESQTNDVGNAGLPQPGDPGFLANGGLPGGGSGITLIPVASDARKLTAAYVPDQKLPYAENWSLGVQHVFHNDYTADVRYLGTRGIHLATQIQLNVQPRVTADNQLPTYIGAAPSTAELQSLGNTLASIKNDNSNIVPAFLDNNFKSKITSYQPWSQSMYNGLAASLNRRMKNGLLLDLSYTFSNTMDDATATVFSTTLTPRRPQNSQNLKADYSRSALNRKHRVTLAAVYDMPFFKNSTWLEKNLLGNWEFAPVYTYESPEPFTVLSGDNANLNGEGSAIDRTIYNPNGVKHTGTKVIAYANPGMASLCPAGSALDPNGVAVCQADTVAYVAANPTAEYVQAGLGTLPNVKRNSEDTRPINNIDATATKNFSFANRYKLGFSVQAFNILNHAQHTPGAVNNVNNTSITSSTTFQTVTSGGLFNNSGKAFAANARTMQLSLKLDF